MICPDCNNDVLLGYCDTCDDMIELSGKMISDDMDNPDEQALMVWYRYGMGQKEMVFG